MAQRRIQVWSPRRLTVSTSRKLQRCKLTSDSQMIEEDDARDEGQNE